MRFGERIVLFIFRPIYRTFFERLVWWFLTKVKIFFFADITAQLDGIERRLQEDHQQRWTAIEELLRRTEAGNTAQWDAMEQLLLALFRQPEVRTIEPERKLSVPQLTSVSSPAKLNGVDGPNDIR